MSLLTCNCPHCGQELDVESEFAGQAVACPTCSGQFAVPVAAALGSPAPAQAPTLAPAPRLNLPGASAARPAQAPPQYQQPQPTRSPYQSPTSNLGGGQAYGGYGGAPSPHSIHLFAQTKPWVTMFAVLGSIWPAAMLLMGLLSAFAGVSAGAVGAGMAGGLLMAVIGAIYFLPAWRLWQYSSAIGKLRISPHPQTLDNAIDRQRCFWKTVGVITLIGIALSILMVVLAFSVAPGVDEADLLPE